MWPSITGQVSLLEREGGGSLGTQLGWLHQKPESQQILIAAQPTSAVPQAAPASEVLPGLVILALGFEVTWQS